MTDHYYENWMKYTPEIHNTKLRYLCLPSSHDSGTYGLIEDEMTNEQLPALKTILDMEKEAEKYLKLIPIYGARYATDFVEGVREGIKRMAQTTSRTIIQQLESGIRCFDLRVYEDGGQFYIHHQLRGPTLDQVLDQFANFAAGHDGEILYLTFGHIIKNKNDFPQKDFENRLISALGRFAFLRQGPSPKSDPAANNVFDRTYREIVIGDDGKPSCRMVLVIDSWVSQDPHFWAKPYSPPEEWPPSDDPKVLLGDYTNTSDLEKMRKEQAGYFQKARDLDLPFALYTTLTPSDGQYVDAVLTYAIAESVSVGKIRDALIKLLKIGRSSWTSLRELNKTATAGLASWLKEFPYNPTTGWNDITFLYADFIEDTDIVDLAIERSYASRLKKEPVPVYSYYDSVGGGNTQKSHAYYYSTSANTPGSYTGEGAAFLAFDGPYQIEAPEGLIQADPIYQLRIYGDDGKDIFAYSADPNYGGLTCNAPVFWAFKTPQDGTESVYQYTRYADGGKQVYGYASTELYSKRLVENGFTKGSSPVFYAYPSGGPVADYRYYQIADDGTELHKYSTSPYPPSNFHRASVAFQAYLRSTDILPAGASVVPVYKFEAHGSSDHREVYAYSTDRHYGGFKNRVSAFYAFENAVDGAEPIFQYTKAGDGLQVYAYVRDGDDEYSEFLKGRGWSKHSTPAFYAPVFDVTP